MARDFRSCFWNKIDSAMALVEAGCDTGLPEKYGRCGYQMAELRKLTDLLSTLDAMGAEKTSPVAGEVAVPTGMGGIIGSDAAHAAGGEDEWGNVRKADETPEERRARAKKAAEKVKIDQVTERMPLTAAIVNETSLLCHNVLNEPSTGLFHTHNHVRRTAGPIHETCSELKLLNQECKQRCLDVDDITPLVDDIVHMTHLGNIRQLIEDSLEMVTPDTRRR